MDDLRSELNLMYNSYCAFYALAFGCTSIHRGYYTDLAEGVAFRDATDRLTRYIVDQADLRADDHLLDVGCGAGNSDFLIAREKCCRVTGVDLGKGQILSARMAVEAAALSHRLQFMVADAEHLPFPDDSFDAVLLFESMCHMKDKRGALSEAKRCLRAGGSLIIAETVELAVPENQAWRARFEEVLPLTCFPAAGQLAGLCSDVGLDVKGAIDLTRETSLTYARGLAEALTRRAEVEQFLGEEACNEIYDELPELVEVLNAEYLGYEVVIGAKPAIQRAGAAPKTIL